MRRFFHMHLISDATGETLNTVARAAMAHYADYQPVEHIYALVRTPRQLQRVLGEIERQLGALKGDGRVDRARAYVKEQIRKIKVASIEAI